MDQKFNILLEANLVRSAKLRELNQKAGDDVSEVDHVLRGARRTVSVSKPQPIHPKDKHPEACRKVPIVLRPYQLP